MSASSLIEREKSVSLAGCRSKGHEPGRHSPDGVEIILECSECCMAWLVKVGGEEIRLFGTYEERLLRQKIERQCAHDVNSLDPKSRKWRCDDCGKEHEKP